MSTDLFRVCADIDLDAVRTNIINMKNGLKAETKVCCVIKADGYGHGAVKIAKAVQDIADFYAVATIGEALGLRASGIGTPLLILGYIHPDGYEDAVRNDIRLTIYDKEDADLLSKAAKKAGKRARLHIKIDTGMSRIGFAPDEKSLDIIKEIYADPGLETEGIFTHLFAADAKDKTSAYAQVEKFTGFCKRLKEEGVDIKIRHCSNSAAAISMPEADLDMVRLGIAQYGLYPSDDVRELELYPAMSLKSHVVMVKDIPKGTSVGYGATYTASEDRRIATIPAGYADGYARSLSNKGRVLINGKYAPITGRVCMDQFMADVTDIPGVRKGSEVILIGSDGENSVTMEEVADISGRFNYEFACDIGKRVPRRYILGGKYVD